MPTFTERIQHAWNAFMSRGPNNRSMFGPFINGVSSSYNASRTVHRYANEQTIVNAVYNRIAIDVASTTIQHVRVDDNGRFSEVVDSGLNNCLTVEANKDQTARAFLQDLGESLMYEGYIAMVPIDTDDDIQEHSSFEILTMRVGKIIQYYPDAVMVRVYNDHTGQREDLIMPKRAVGLVENPFYSIMNENNSTLQRLIHKLNLLDAVDEQTGAGKLDLIIQLPYVIRGDLKKKQAEERRKQIEEQLAGSKYGIAYTDGTEHVTQLNRSVDNSLMGQIEYLTSMLYSQLGLTTEIMNGTADEATMLNYYNRTIEPIVAAICDEMYRKFLTKTARSRRQKILYYRDPFRLVPVSQLAEIADKFTRNEIMSPNEIRQIIGMKPIDAPGANELRNRNLNVSEGYTPVYADEDLNTDQPMSATNEQTNTSSGSLSELVDNL